MNDPISLLSHGPPETVLIPEPEEVLAALTEAAASSDLVTAFGSVCIRWPKCLEAWASLGESLEASEATPALAYAAFRAGYHRGLDRLRAGGWRGSGYVRWQHQTNRGFLRSLSGLQRLAIAIGEDDEAQRCAVFLLQLDPEWPPSELAGE